MRTRVRWVRVLVPVLVSMVVALGPGAIPASAAPIAPGEPNPSQPGDQAASAPMPAGMAADEQAAVAAIDGFWRRHFRELSSRPYRSPNVHGGYFGSNGPTCGGEPAVPFNAFYCKPGDFLAWDQDLMTAGYSKIGDSWVYLVIAHEWGHAIQNRLRRGLTEKSVELQADCLAGATLQGAARDGLVHIEEGDDEELARTLAASADDYPWTDQRDHGDAQQRIGAFNTGAQQGIRACLS